MFVILVPFKLSGMLFDLSYYAVRYIIANDHGLMNLNVKKNLCLHKICFVGNNFSNFPK